MPAMLRLDTSRRLQVSGNSKCKDQKVRCIFLQILLAKNNPERSSSLVLATESNVVVAFYNQLLSIWESIPRINKAPEILKKKFQEQE